MSVLRNGTSPRELTNTNPTINIRTASAADVLAIADFWQLCEMVTEFNDPLQDLSFALSFSTSTVLIGEEPNGRIVGTVMVGHDGHRGNLYYLAVAQDLRCRGIGRRLVASAEGWLCEMGIRKIHLLVLNDNAEVRGFYEKLGYGIGPAILMRKWLT